MGFLGFESNYDRFPETVIEGFDNEAWSGWKNIYNIISQKMDYKKTLVIDCYPGVYENEIKENVIDKMDADVVISMEDIFYDGDKITELMHRNLTDSRVWGIMYIGTIMDFISVEKLKKAKEKVKNAKGTCIVYGFGAALVTKGDVLVYADMARWEIQLRYRKGMPNYKQKNYNEEQLGKYKRGFFIEWRIADRHKETLYDDIDLYLDTNVENKPAMISGDGFRNGLIQMTKTPFRMVPYFDPGVWGGQWMKEVCNLDKEKINYAWSFDGVPEENSVYMRFGNVRIETPAHNMTLYLPKEFVGRQNYARFGAEFPMRFTFLDTMEGQNLSLQVHPTTDHIYKKYGMSYTQDESYYILDCGEGGGVYLGLKEEVDGDEMINALRDAQTGGAEFDADKYVNFFPAKKHDHFLIPAGTVHCSSANCMVLEISSGKYIFTYKLWDWNRVGLDGLPRPINVEEGAQVIQFERTTEWVKDNLVNNFSLTEENEQYKKVRTGLHQLEFIDTYATTIRENKTVTFKSDGEVAMLNLVEGEEAVIESPDGDFKPFKVHFAETVVIPAMAGDYTVRPADADTKIMVVTANIRHN